MIGFGAGSFQAMARIHAGDEIIIDNSVYKMAQTYHHHQIQAPNFYVWNQFKIKTVSQNILNGPGLRP